MDLSAFFTRDDSYAFLNAGTLSRSPLAVLDWMEARRREEERAPTKAVFEGMGSLWKTQVALAPFLGADPEDLYLRSNITSALNDFFFALPLEKGEVLVSGWEYGATANLARWRAQQSGLSFRVAEIPLGLPAADVLRRLVESLGPDTRVVVVSHVFTGDGSVLDVAAFAREARRLGVVVVVDGAHAVGALPLDLRLCEYVDFYGGNFHKWFMGPKGTAFGWVHPRWRGKLQWRFGGWASFGRPAHYQGFEGGEEAARRALPGTMDTAPFEGLRETLAFWERIGPSVIRARQRRLRDLASELASGFGWERVTPEGGDGPLVSFRVPPPWPKELGSVALATRLYKERRVQVALPVVQGEMLLRLSPGAYATENEVREGLGRMKEFS